MNLQKLDWEQAGRACIEYGGIPLALFMAIGIVVRFLEGQGIYMAFFDPAQNLPLYYILNAWTVGGVYVYRQKYHSALVYERSKELGLAAVAAFTWLATQPLLLLLGYGIYLVAVMRKDSMDSSFLPDIEAGETAQTGEDVASGSHSWGYLQRIQDHLFTGRR